tara:strand:+ start:138 stop:356 length:219 start_codon:yes stop_codon:yes gene_type:complete
MDTIYKEIPENELIEFMLLSLIEGELEKDMISMLLLLIIEDKETQNKLINLIDTKKLLNELKPYYTADKTLN